MRIADGRRFRPSASCGRACSKRSIRSARNGNWRSTLNTTCFTVGSSGWTWDPLWDHSSFTRNRERLLNETVARAFFAKVLALAEWKGVVSSEHFTVDGTLIEA